MGIIFLSCHKATELTEKQTVYKLSMAEEMKLRFHIKMCDVCKSYQEQSKIIEEGIRKFYEGRNDLKLSDELKNKILAEINH